MQTRGFKYFVLLFSVGCVFTTCLDGLIPNNLYTGQNSSEPECIPELFAFNSSTSLSFYVFQVVLLSGLEIGDSIHISSINLDESVKPTIQDRDFTIATVAPPTVMKVEEAAKEVQEDAEVTDKESQAVETAKDKEDDKSAAADNATEKKDK